MEMASFPQKIVLKSTTKISLNDRFTNIQKVTTQRQQQQQQQFRATLAAQQQASSRNRRLTLQMANRPAVQAALKLKARSLKQRLGSNVRARLNLRGARGGVRGTIRGGPRGGRGLGRGRGQGFRGQLKRSQSAGSQLSVTSPTPSYGSVARGRGGRGARGFRGLGRGGFRGRGGGRGFFRGVGQSSRMPIRGARGGIRGSNQMKIQRGRGRGRRRGGRGMRGEGRGGRGRGGGGDVSKEALDAQLDEYMANSQSGADGGLDTFMTD